MIPGVNLLRGYQRSWLRGDLVAGLTVAAYLVPQVMAYATVAGLPPVAGLWAALPALVVYALLGSSRSLSMGPEATTALMTAISIGPLAAGEPARYAELAASLALLTGLMSLAAWLLRLGFVAELLSRPVLVGYMAGVALIMIAGQLGRVTGVPVTGDGPAAQVTSFLGHLGHVRPAPVLIAGAVLAFLLVVRSRWPRAPGTLVAMTAATVAVALLGPGSGVSVVGPIPAGLPIPVLPDIHLPDLRELLLPAFSVLIVGFSDDVLTARSFARRGENVRANQELLALGAGNIAVSSAAFAKAGGFDATLEACEDVDLCHRIRATGRRMLRMRVIGPSVCQGTRALCVWTSQTKVLRSREGSHSSGHLVDHCRNVDAGMPEGAVR
jgi:MFS superfamily sulfate permease-like transporter